MIVERTCALAGTASATANHVSASALTSLRPRAPTAGSSGADDGLARIHCSKSRGLKVICTDAKSLRYFSGIGSSGLAARTARSQDASYWRSPLDWIVRTLRISPSGVRLNWITANNALSAPAQAH